MNSQEFSFLIKIVVDTRLCAIIAINVPVTKSIAHVSHAANIALNVCCLMLSSHDNDLSTCLYAK